MSESTTTRQLLSDAAEQAGQLEADTNLIVARIRRRRRARTGAAGLVTLCAATAAVLLMFGPAGSVTPAAAPPAGPAPVGPSVVEMPCWSTAVGIPANAPSLGFRGSSCHYLGLTLDAARTLAAQEGLKLEVLVPGQGITYDLNFTRLRVRAVDNIVVSAHIG
ncbi:hypothetical protein ACIA8O_10590 [Kitasatospora sp. NPDC051853]|uniref:hypothetical protein n=1 Tax=Kitasatospora sp. NPDC051853 TaxID=3364058 RepID=UPI0037ACFAC7